MPPSGPARAIGDLRPGSSSLPETLDRRTRGVAIFSHRSLKNPGAKRFGRQLLESEGEALALLVR